MPIIEIGCTNPGSLGNWNAIALPINSDGVCGKGITYDLLNQHPGAIDFLRGKGSYKRHKRSNLGGVRYFAYDVGKRFVLLEWRSTWKRDMDLVILEESLLDFKESYIRNAIETIVFPDWGWGGDNGSFEEVYSLIKRTLSDTGLIVGIIKPK